MRGDIINLNDENRKTAWNIVEPLLHEINKTKGIYNISVAGESGAGKSIIATAIAEQLENKGIKVKIFQQDDYFRLPPFSNDKKRRDDLMWVGTDEVDLNLIDQHLKAAKDGSKTIEKPLVIYPENRITKEVFDMSGIKVCIAEGTYTSLLKNIDKRIFIDRDRFDTMEDRHKRGREVMDTFIEKVLEIEHKIISRHKDKADIIIDKNFRVHFVK
jgi:uridine kinase